MCFKTLVNMVICYFFCVNLSFLEYIQYDRNFHRLFSWDCQYVSELEPVYKQAVIFCLAASCWFHMRTNLWECPTRS